MSAQKLHRSNTILDIKTGKGSMDPGSVGLIRSQSAEGREKKLSTLPKKETFSLTEVKGKKQDNREATMKQLKNCHSQLLLVLKPLAKPVTRSSSARMTRFNILDDHPKLASYSKSLVLTELSHQYSHLSNLLTELAIFNVSRFHTILSF